MLPAFYRGLLPSAGHYCLFRSGRKAHIWCDTIDELVAKTERYADTTDLYFALSSFSTTEGRTKENALLSRAFYFDIDAGPEKFLKHGDAVYPTQKHALQALVDWCKEHDMEPSLVVSSGAGVHVYYAIDRDLTIEEWQPVADALKAKALATGLKIDAAVTGDAARVLRPVGTLHKSGAEVKALTSFKAPYTLEWMREKTAGYAAKPRTRASSINDEILAAPVGPPKSLAKIQGNCAAMAYAMNLRGDVPEPYWRAMLGVIKFTVEGEDAAHLYSQGSPDYSYDETQDKLDRWAAGPTTCAVFEGENPAACAGCKHKGKVKSPALLGYMTPDQVAALPPEPEKPAADEPFSSFGEDDEDGIPEEKKVKYPWDGHMPENFRIAPHKGGFVMIYKHKILVPDPAGGSAKIEKEVETAFCQSPFWFESWAAGNTNEDEALAVYCVYDVTSNTVGRFTFPTRLAAKRDSMFGALATQNVQVFPNTNLARQAMEDNVKAQLERIRRLHQRQKIQERFGTMHDKNGDIVIAQGTYLIDGKGFIREGVAQERLRGRARAYRVPVPDRSDGEWGPDVWATDILPQAKRHIEYLREFYDTPNFSPYQLAIMLAWSSPMMAFMQGTYRPGNNLPGVGLTVSLYSPRSGIGKTAAMHAAALAFGSPSDLCLQLDRNGSTNNARQAVVVQSGTMPVFLDEMEDVPAADLSSLVSSVGNGQPKGRMTRELGLVGGTTFSLVNVMSTNKSHRELVAADRAESAAVQMRLLEIECSGVLPVSPERARQETQARSNLHDCAGAVGAMIHRRMAALGSEQLNALGMECAEKAREMLGGQQDGRMMWRAFGGVLAIRRMLKADGLQVFSLDTLVAEFKRWMMAGYEFAEDNILPTDPASVMAMFLSDISGKTLVTQNESQRHGGAEAKVDIPLNDRMPDPVLARAVLNGRYVYVKTQALRDWCAAKKLGFQATISKCREAGLLHLANPDAPRQFAHKIDLLKGTKLSMTVRDSVIKVWLDKLPSEVLPAHASGDNVVELKIPASVKSVAEAAAAMAT